MPKNRHHYVLFYFVSKDSGNLKIWTEIEYLSEEEYKEILPVYLSKSNYFDHHKMAHGKYLDDFNCDIEIHESELAKLLRKWGLVETASVFNIHRKTLKKLARELKIFHYKKTDAHKNLLPRVKKSSKEEKLQPCRQSIKVCYERRCYHHSYCEAFLKSGNITAKELSWKERMSVCR